LEAARSISETYDKGPIYCIRSRGHDLYEDLKSYFSPPGNYVLLVDDANRASKFEYIIHLLEDRKEDQTLVVIATVRDYAKSQILDSPIGGLSIYHSTLESLTDEAIKDIARKEFGILNYRYLDRIANIAQGNARLAMMAASCATTEGALSSISDVSALYEEFYRSVRRDIEELDDPAVISTAGIVSFLRAINLLDENAIGKICGASDLTQEDFMRHVHKLHDLEIVDLYEDSTAVRISDEVLGTYLFYRAVFVNKTLALEKLLHEFFPLLRQRFVDAFSSVLGAFQRDEIYQHVESALGKYWKSREALSTDDDFIVFLGLAWPFYITNAMVRADTLIANSPRESVDTDQIKFTASAAITGDHALAILDLLAHADLDVRKQVTVLALNYAERCPSHVPGVLYLLTKSLGFQPSSSDEEYTAQQYILDEIWLRSDDGDNYLFSRIFLTISSEFLKTEFMSTRMTRGNKLGITQFKMVDLPQARELRNKTWTRLLHLYATRKYGSQPLDVVDEAIIGSHEHGFLNSDAETLTNSMARDFSTASFRECLSAHRLLTSLQKQKIDRFNNRLLPLETNNIRLFELVVEDPYGRRLFHGENESEDSRWLDISDGLDVEGYLDLVDACYEFNAVIKEHQVHEFQAGVTRIFLTAFERSPEMFSRLVESYIGSRKPFLLERSYGNIGEIVRRLTKCVAPTQALSILSKLDVPIRTHCLLLLCLAIPETAVTKRWLKRTCKLFEAAEVVDLAVNLDGLLKYRKVDPLVVVRVTELVLAKVARDSRAGHVFNYLFLPHRECRSLLLDLFHGHFDLLERAYLEWTSISPLNDHDGAVLFLLMERTPDLLFQFLDRQIPLCTSYSHNRRDLAFIWRHPDAAKLMPRIVERFYKSTELGYRASWVFFDMVLKRHPDGGDGSQAAIIDRLIADHISDREYIEFLFEALGELAEERRRSHLAALLRSGCDLQLFKQIDLEPKVQAYSGSGVEEENRRIQFLESLLPFVNSLELVRHKQYLEQRISNVREQIEVRKRSSFLFDS